MKCVKTNLGNNRQEGKKPSNECFIGLPLTSFLYCSHCPLHSMLRVKREEYFRTQILLFIVGISTMSFF